MLGKHVGWSEEIEKEKPALSRTAEALIDVGVWDEPTEEVEYVEHEGTSRFRLARAIAWKPLPGRKVSLEAVRETICDLHEIFDLEAIAIDPAQGDHRPRF